MAFDDCKGNDKLNFKVSNPDFKVEPDGSLVARKNVTEAGRALFIHARSSQTEDMAEIVILGGKEKHGSLKVTQIHMFRRDCQKRAVACKKKKNCPVKRL